MVGLNILKPLSSLEMKIARKCGWADRIEFTQRKHFVAPRVKSEGHDFLADGKKTKLLTENQRKIMEIFSANSKLATSPYCCVNMNGIFDIAKTDEGVKMLQKLLTPETVGKLDYQRILVSKHPKDYLKDKTEAKYLKTPAGLNSLFKDISLLKAAYIMDKEALNSLLKMDITVGKGKALLRDIGRFNSEQLDRAKKEITNPSTQSMIFDVKI